MECPFHFHSGYIDDAYSRHDESVVRRLRESGLGRRFLAIDRSSLLGQGSLHLPTAPVMHDHPHGVVRGRAHGWGRYSGHDWFDSCRIC